MNNLVTLNNGVLTATSKEIADHFGKTHKHVLEAIKNLECTDKFRQPNFRPSFYISAQNKKLKCFDITRDGFSFLCMGFTGKKSAEWKEAYIVAFNRMEGHLIKTTTVMDKINEVLLTMEKDKEVASICSKGLNEWKKLKKSHKEEVDRLVNESQFALNLG